MKLTRAEKKQKTIKKILSVSLRLYNKDGAHSVSMHSIAKEAGISPGNLTYHFRKKNDIIHTLVDELESEILSVLGATREIGAVMEDHAKVLIRLVNVLWKYRFFFNSLVFLTGQNTIQRERYLHLKTAVIDVLMEGYEQLIANGSILPIEDDLGGPKLFLENLWHLILSQLRLYILESPNASIGKKAYSEFAAKHIYAYMSSHYGTAVRDGYSKFLNREFG